MRLVRTAGAGAVAGLTPRAVVVAAALLAALSGCGRAGFIAVTRDGAPAADGAVDGSPDASFDAPPADGAVADAPTADVTHDDAAMPDAGGPRELPAVAWVATPSSPGIQSAVAIDADPAGNVVVGGYTVGPADLGGGVLPAYGLDDAFVASYAPDGSHRWSRVLGSANVDRVWDLAIDAAGNVYVAGSYFETVETGGGPLTSNGDRDGFVISYDARGAFRWAVTIGATLGDIAFGIDVDSAGNVYVNGWFYETFDLGSGPVTATDNQDIYVASFTSDGAIRYARAFGGMGIDQSQKIAVNAAGEAAIGGLFSGVTNLGAGAVPTAGGRDAFVLRADGTGAPRWSRTFGAEGTDEAHGIAIDEASDVYVSGTFEATVDFGSATRSSAGMGDAYLAAFAGDGTPRWVSTFGGSSTDILSRVVAAPGGVLVAGGQFGGTVTVGSTTLSAAGGIDGILLAYDRDGTLLWTLTVGGPSGQDVRDVAVGLDGRVYVAGVFYDTVDFGTGPITANSADLFVLVLGP